MVPKILLLVNSDPAGTGIGELFLSEIGRMYPDDCIVRYSTVQNIRDSGESTWLGFRSIIRYVPASRWPVISSICEWIFSLKTVNSIAKEIAKIIEEEEINILWAVLSSGPMISLTERLMLNAKVPLVSTVLDDPEYFARNQYIDPLTWRHMHSQFVRVLRKSERISVISESMQSIYRIRYGVESVIMRHGIDESYFQAWDRNGSNGHTIRIGFAGSLYAKNEWNALLKMLDSVDGRVAGKSVRVSFIGRMPRTGVNSSRYVDKLGSMPFDASIDALGKTDIAYLPYWFDRRHSSTVRTSFPGKLSTYAACGLPVLFHGPFDSSVTPFLRNFPFGKCCHSLDVKVIHDAVVELITDDKFRQQASNARDEAWRKELSKPVMLQRFCALVNCKLADLRP